MEGLDQGFGFSLQPSEGLPGINGAWGDLAQAVGADAESLDGALLGDAINRRGANAPGSQIYIVVRELLLDPPYDPAGPGKFYERAAALIVALEPEILARALASQSNQGDRRKVIMAAVAWVAPAGVHTIARASGLAYGRPVSRVHDALLNELKLDSVTLAEPARAKADSAFRSLVRHTVETWSASTVDTSASGYEEMFSRAAEVAVGSPVAPEPERVVQLALEIGAVGNVLWSAVSELSQGDGMRKLLGMLNAAPEGSRAAAMIAQQFANPQRLTMLLREDEVDFNAIDALLRHMGPNAAEPLLDELTTATSRTVRRGILDRLAALGPAVGPFVLTRLKDERWFVIRNLLHVLHATDSDMSQVNLIGFQNHSDSRVRREAMQLLFKDPIARDRALATAFKDTDSGMIRTALKAARTGLPDVAVPVLSKRLLDPDFPPEFRVPAIQLIGRSKSMLALDTLLKYVQGGTTLLGKPKLANKSPEMIAALKGLVHTWPQERRSRPLIDLAAHSRDAQLMAAADPRVPKKDEAEL